MPTVVFMNIRTIKKMLSFALITAVLLAGLIPAQTAKAEEQNNTLITIVARNVDNNSRITTARFIIKNNSGQTLAFTKAPNGIYVYSDMGNTQIIEMDSKGKAQVSNLPLDAYILSDNGNSSEYISSGNVPFAVNSLDDQFEVSMDYSLNIGTLALSFVDGDTNEPIKKGRFVLKDSNGNLVNVTNVNNKGGYECSNSKSGAGEFLTNNQGKATVSNIPAGNYILEQVYAPAKYNSGLVTKRIVINSKDTTSVIVSNTGRYGDLTVKLRSANDSKKIYGYVFKIVNQDGFAVPLYESEDNTFYYNYGGKNTEVEVKSASTDLNVIGLPQGSYTLHMEKGIKNYKKIGDVRFTITNGKNNTITVKATRTTGSIAIIKKDKTTQKPLAGFKVKILSKDGKTVYSFRKNEKNEYEYVSEDTEGASKELVTDDNGKIMAIKIPTGTVVIKEIAAPDGYMYSRENTEQTVASSTETVYETTSEKSNCVLEFINEANESVKDVGVRIIDLNGKIILESKSNENGYVLMSNIAEGTYTYEVTEVPSTYALPEAKAEFSISKDGVATNLSPISVEYNKISATVIGLDDVADKSGIEFTITNSDGKNFTAVTGADGVAVFVQVPYGNYSMKQTSGIDGYDISQEVYDNILVDGKFKNMSYEYRLNPASVAQDDSQGKANTETLNNDQKTNIFMGVIIILLLILLCAFVAIAYIIVSAKKKPEKDNKQNPTAPLKRGKEGATKTSRPVLEDPKENGSEPIIIKENAEDIADLTRNEKLVVPEDVNDRKPKKNSKPIDPFKNKK